VSGEDLHKTAGMRRVLESTLATLTGGLILWWLTAPTSQPAPLPQSVLMAQPISLSRSSLHSPDAIDDPPVLSAGATAPLPVVSAAKPETTAATPPASGPAFPNTAAHSGPAAPISLPKSTGQPTSIPLGATLLYEDFSRYRDGQPTGWGANISVTTGLDRRKWLVPVSNGTYPIGYSLRLPAEFYLELRYAANMSNVTRGVLGLGKEPITTKLSFPTDRGARYEIEWVIGCGNDITRLNPLGSSSLCARRYYHTIKLPGGATGQAEVLQPTGTLRIARDNGAIQVLLGGQPIVAGTVAQATRFVGFEVNAVMAKNGTLSFTEFKIGR
jgi:hypothetical protein